ncbi:hypothetical protein WDW37_05555 [Bdellovibrionota bacterium FG-1]
MNFLLFILGCLFCSHSHAFDLNEAHFDNAPKWLKPSTAQRVVDAMDAKLEWDIRKIQVQYHENQEEFRKLHGFDDSVLAFTRGTDTSVHLGPRVVESNFESVFGHELVHVILRQKYKNAIPRWLEEGLANYLSKHGKVDYAWLASQPTRDVYSLAHPFAEARPVSTEGARGGARYHYQASQALMEMLATHCPPQDLLQLSVGKKLESYLPTLCGIQDLNAEFKAWLKRKGT